MHVVAGGYTPVLTQTYTGQKGNPHNARLKMCLHKMLTSRMITAAVIEAANLTQQRAGQMFHLTPPRKLPAPQLSGPDGQLVSTQTLRAILPG